MKKHLAFALVVSFISAGQAMAWGQEGHSIVGELAQRHLTANTLAGIKKLLGGEVSLASIASWADDYRSTTEGAGTAGWHFAGGDIRNRELTKNDCPDTGCIVSAIPAQIAIIRDHSKSDSERRQALLLLVHFMGDLEQPIHLANNGNDRGGGTLWVKMDAKRPDGNSFKRTMKLHEMWDSGLINLHVYDWGWYVTELDGKPLPAVDPGPYDETTVLNWANQTHCKGIEAYRLLVPSIPPAPSGGCEGIDGGKITSTNDESNPLPINNTYTDLATPIVSEQLALGGARLAAVLEYAFAP